MRGDGGRLDPHCEDWIWMKTRNRKNRTHAYHISIYLQFKFLSTLYIHYFFFIFSFSLFFFFLKMDKIINKILYINNKIKRNKLHQNVNVMSFLYILLCTNIHYLFFLIRIIHVITFYIIIL